MEVIMKDDEVKVTDNGMNELEENTFLDSNNNTINNNLLNVRRLG
jgi:hypothetical protein